MQDYLVNTLQATDFSEVCFKLQETVVQQCSCRASAFRSKGPGFESRDERFLPLALFHKYLVSTGSRHRVTINISSKRFKIKLCSLVCIVKNLQYIKFGVINSAKTFIGNGSGLQIYQISGLWVCASYIKYCQNIRYRTRF